MNRNHILTGLLSCRRRLKIGGSAVERVVDLLNDVRSSDGAAGEDTAVKPLEGLLAATDRIELDINIPLRRSRIHGDVDHFPVFLVTFAFYFGLQAFSPVGARCRKLSACILA